MSRESKMIWLIRAGLLVVVMTVAVLVFGPFGGDEEKFGLTDKEAHAMAFYAITALALLAMPRLRKWDVAILALAFGGAIEIIQPYVGRDGNLPDFLADSIGVSLAIVPMVFQSVRQALRGNRASHPQRRKTDQRRSAGTPSYRPGAHIELRRIRRL